MSDGIRWLFKCKENFLEQINVSGTIKDPSSTNPDYIFSYVLGTNLLQFAYTQEAEVALNLVNHTYAAEAMTMKVIGTFLKGYKGIDSIIFYNQDVKLRDIIASTLNSSYLSGALVKDGTGKITLDLNAHPEVRDLIFAKLDINGNQSQNIIVQVPITYDLDLWSIEESWGFPSGTLENGISYLQIMSNHSRYTDIKNKVYEGQLVEISNNHGSVKTKIHILPEEQTPGYIQINFEDPVDSLNIWEGFIAKVNQYSPNYTGNNNSNNITGSGQLWSLEESWGFPQDGNSVIQIYKNDANFVNLNSKLYTGQHITLTNNNGSLTTTITITDFGSYIQLNFADSLSSLNIWEGTVATTDSFSP